MRVIKYSLIFIIAAFLTCSGCASAKKKGYRSKQDEALCDLSRLGRNKYYYSSQYQRKLRKSEHKISGKY